MSKKLYTPKQALNNIRNNYFNSERNPDHDLEYEWFDIVETALKNQANLELENKTLQMNVDLGVALAKGLQKKIDENKKEHESLKIIKEKRVDIGLLLANSLDTYNQLIFVPERQLTQEEYKSLKEVLKDE